MKKQTTRILIICNGGPEKKEFLQKQASRADLVICADGGADKALAAGVTPAVVIGDLDSVSAKAKKAFKNSIWIKVARQDNTDMEKALDFALEQKPGECVIVCAAGGRTDFAISNFIDSFKYCGKLNFYFAGENWLAYPIKKSAEFNARKGDRVSIIPFGGIKGLTLTGLKYTLKNFNLKKDRTGNSNTAAGKKFKVDFKSGNILVYIEKV